MSDEPRDPGWPAEAGDIEQLPREIDPPPALEDRVTRALIERGLISDSATRPAAGAGRWRPLPGWLLAAASVLLVIGGFLAGRATVGRVSPGPAEAGELYALLLYETGGYDRPRGRELLERYREYSRWVAEARRRGQFVTGEDLAVEEGWLMSPGAGAARRTPGLAPAEAAPLSGLFLITAADFAQAMALAESLPHLRHGGQVVVQRVVPTESPPRVEQPGAAG